jgi:phosphoribosylformylglycinamidine (FGAM) synthase-like enzyme
MTPSTTPLYAQLGMTADEYSSVCALLDREPTGVELAMYSVMWSEHCSYKSSRTHLRRLPTEAPWVLVGPGEGAGVIDIGEGMAVAVRIESHNHPSAVEPYQGAATGVGGIIRDVFSMGARPIALMDSLRFGPLSDSRNRWLFEGVVSGISGYGNSVGVPTVGGEVVFEDGYSGNPLVNVFCLGLLPSNKIVKARAERSGDLAVLLGAATGRDGIGGASILASAEFDETSQDKRPSVQVGDPFQEKKLIEVCLDLLERGLVAGIQDLGAAGICCAASESAANGGRGIEIDLARIPRRAPGMSAAELMISESQERMLAIVEPSDLDAVLERCNHHEVNAAIIGRVNDTRRFTLVDGVFDVEGVPGRNAPEPSGKAGTSAVAETGRGDERFANVPVESLGEGPEYRRPLSPDPGLKKAQDIDVWARMQDIGVDEESRAEELLRILARPTIASKAWVYRQYDHQLFLQTVVGPGGDATVLRVNDTKKGLALSVDGPGRMCELDPRTGAHLAVAEAARNVACAGGVPRALVNCLNFGDPGREHVMWQFSEVIDGMAEMCEALSLPVVGGNVSFYNATDGVDIFPTPVLGVVGVIEDLERRPPTPALVDGDEVVVLGATLLEVAGSEWAAEHGVDGGMPPACLPSEASRLIRLIIDLVDQRLVNSTHDCAEGGLGVTLAEMCIAGGVGIEGRPGLTHDLPEAAWLFSESANRVVCGIDPANVETVEQLANDAQVPFRRLGIARGQRLSLPSVISVPLASIDDVWSNSIERTMKSVSAQQA